MDRAANAKTSAAGWPAVLHYSLSLGTENAESRAHRVDPLQHYLETRSSIPVEITTTTNYGGTIEAMRARKVDAASMGPFAYLIASEKAGAGDRDARIDQRRKRRRLCRNAGGGGR